MERKHQLKDPRDTPGSSRPGLDIVLKCDSAGSLEAAMLALSVMTDTGEIGIIRAGVGAINKSDIVMAETAGRLIVGFQVGLVPGTERLLMEHRVEVRLYEVIYTLTADIKDLIPALSVPAPAEQVVGSAKVIALFKSTRKGIIIGCEVLDGHLSVGQHFRIITAAGPVYTGLIESIHAGDRVIQKAIPGQKMGIKIRDFNKARLGDLVESYRAAGHRQKTWEPSGGIVRK